jgi:hypothetical protein
VSVVYRPPAARYGYRVITAGVVDDVRDLDAASGHLAHAYAEQMDCRVLARVTLSRERPLTAAETAELAERAAARLRR